MLKGDSEFLVSFCTGVAVDPGGGFFHLKSHGMLSYMCGVHKGM